MAVKNREIYRKIFLSIPVIILVLAGGELPQRISITQSASVLHRVFFIIKAGDNIKKDEYVIFNIQHPLSHNGTVQAITKKVVCVEGNNLSVVGKDFYCNGEHLGTAKEFSLLNEKMPVFNFNGIIPKGKVFVMGDHKDSFDSRYWGFLDVKDIKYTAWPIY